MPILDANTLIAYVDGELDPATARRVEVMLDDDAEARAFVAGLRGTTALARVAYNDALYEDVPERLVAAAGGPAGAGKMAASSAPSLQRRQSWRSVYPIAAALALLEVGLGGFLTGSWLNKHDLEAARDARIQDRTIAASALSRALETQVSGNIASWRNPDTATSGTITPIRTYRNPDGRYCREYRQAVMRDDESEETLGLACRTGEGTWKTRIVIFNEAT